MIFKRMITQLLIKAVKQYPIVGVMGPRQSGKTTIVRHSFPNYTYVTMENLDTRAEALIAPMMSNIAEVIDGAYTAIANGM